MKKRVISTPALLLSSVSAIIGSGWLFAAYYAATITSSSALLSWVIGAVAIIIVAFTFAELSAFVPVTGASIRVPRYTHGQFVGFIFAWIIWITYVAIMAIEVQAIIQYASFFFPNLVYASGGLTHVGYIVAISLIFIVSVINFYSLKWLLHCNSALTILKIVIPLIIVAAILVAQFPVTHDDIGQLTFAPQGFKGILATLTTGGIIFAFNGFRQATELAGEAKNPHRSLPIAVVGSVLLSLLVYLALQYGFLTSVATDAHLADWQSLKLSGTNSPFAIVLVQEKLGHFLPILYVGAIIGPFAAALMYGSSGARALYAMSLNDSLPKIFAHLSHKGIPVVAIGANFVLGMLLFAPFPGWKAMASFLTSLMALTYIVSPVCVLTMRDHLPDHERYFKLPFARIWNFVAFYICALLVYWTGWDILVKLFIGLILGFILLVVYRLFSHERAKLFHLDWRPSGWVWVFFIGMAVISYLGSFGGKNILTFGWDFFALGILSLASMWCGVKFAMPTAQMEQDIHRLLKEHQS